MSTQVSITEDRVMPAPHVSPFLRRVLLADAVVSGASGLFMAAGAGYLTQLLALPEDLLRYAGLILLPYGALVAWVATRTRLLHLAVWAVIAVNALWAIDSIVLLLSGWVTPTIFGYIFVIVQALVVALLAELQYVGIRRTTTSIA